MTGEDKNPITVLLLPREYYMYLHKKIVISFRHCYCLHVVTKIKSRRHLANVRNCRLLPRIRLQEPSIAR